MAVVVVVVGEKGMACTRCGVWCVRGENEGGELSGEAKT